MGPRQDLVENLVHQQNLTELQRKLEELHPADIAYILEALPLDERRLVWGMVGAENDGEILLEVSDSVRESLIQTMGKEELLAAAESLDTDEIADIAPDLPRDVIQELLTTLDVQKRAHLQSALAYPEDTAGTRHDHHLRPRQNPHAGRCTTLPVLLVPDRCTWGLLATLCHPQ